ncbi:MAG: GLUG motif-containing protein, partial [Phycisphaerales bacterium]
MKYGIILIIICLFIFPAQAKYSGGTGEPNDPYLIATTEDLMLLGNSPEDYDKHFILTADIDLDPNLPGGQVFDRAIVAPDTDADTRDFRGSGFTGSFDGSGYKIRNLTIDTEGADNEYLGLFGRIDETGEVKDLNIENVIIVGGEDSGIAGGLAGWNSGTIIASHSTGSITCGYAAVGGLVGWNKGAITVSDSNSNVTGQFWLGGLVGLNLSTGIITDSYATGVVSASQEPNGDFVGLGIDIGGLVGSNAGKITNCFAAGGVSGNQRIGGLVGSNELGEIISCYSISSVAGTFFIGGLVGYNWAIIRDCYSTSDVEGNKNVGGLVGINEGEVIHCYSTGSVMGNDTVGGLSGFNKQVVFQSFWDIETSGQTASAGG